VSLPEPAQLVELPARRSAWRAALVALRPRQWTKNLLLFGGIVFAAKLGDFARWVDALAAFAAYCAASSASYLVNDVRDAPHDRAHPIKRLRPIARGEVSPHLAEAMAALLLFTAFLLVAPLGLPSILFLCTFFALQAAYTLTLKHVVLLDVMTIGGLFVVRAAAGAAAVHVRISPWLLLCTALLALFLALAKRRGELASRAGTGGGRAVLDGYSFPLVDQLVSIVAACTIVAYSLYTFEAREGSAMMATIPFVVFGLFRYLMLMHREDLGEEPESVLLSDVPILATIALWALTSALILGFS
jgi:4-hydroxybenzoate polyprenyltransferase